MVSLGMRCFHGKLGSSGKYHPPISTELELALNSSIVSRRGGVELLNTSLITTPPSAEGGMPAPGEPKRCALARYVPVAASASTSVNPNPSGVTGHGARSL